MEHNIYSYGHLIPTLKNHLGDVIPGCVGTSQDRVFILRKDEKTSLDALFDTPDHITHNFSIGVNWDPIPGKNVDLDVGCLMLNEQSDVVDFVSYYQLKSVCGSINHGGDAREDAGGDDDDEQVHMRMESIPEDVMYIAYYVTSYDGNPLRDVASCNAHLFETESRRNLIIMEVDDDDIKIHTSVLLCLFFKRAGKWYFLNATKCADGQLLHDNLENLQDYIKNNSNGNLLQVT
jgi:stress response protein SCP2